MKRCTNFFLLSSGSFIWGHRKVTYCIYVHISAWCFKKKKKGRKWHGEIWTLMHRLLTLCNSTDIIDTFLLQDWEAKLVASVLCWEQNKKSLPQRDSSHFLVCPACLKNPVGVFQVLPGSCSHSQEGGLLAEGRMGSAWASAFDKKGRIGLLYLMCWEGRRWFGTCRESDNNLTWKLASSLVVRPADLN